MLRHWLVCGGFGLLTASAVMYAGVSRADVNDDTFVRAIDEHGITYTSEANLIAAAYAVCSDRSRGYTNEQIVEEVTSVTELDNYNAGFFVDAAEAAYCPQYSSGGPLKRAV